MIKLKDILSELLIAEALPPSVAKEYTSIKRNKSIQRRLDSIFTELDKMEGASTSKRGDRVYFPFSSSEGMITQDSPVKKDVESALQGTDYKLKDYKTGIVVDKLGRDMKLGKALTKLGKTDVLNKFRDDPTRESSKKTEFIIVFSKHQYDIAGMSTDRGWTSCMNLYKGEYKEYVEWDVKEGSFICYLTKPEDTNLNKPTGRILVKPYTNTKDKNDVLYSPESKIYGTAPNGFLTTVRDVLNNIQGEKLGTFNLSDELYCDTRSNIRRYPEEIQNILDGKTKAKDESTIKQILEILGVNNYTINSDLSVDVNGIVNIDENELKSIPVQFRNVSEHFYCNGNEFTSLEGAPQKVGGDFDCAFNQLNSLKGAPKEVGGDFDCGYNHQLSTLEGAPQKVGGNFISFNNENLRQSEKDWAEKNIKAERFSW